MITYYTGPVLARAIDAVLRQEGVVELIIIDNGNWDGAVEAAIGRHQENGPAIRVISGHGNIGFAAACNMGARAAVGEFLLFVNPDAVLPERAAAQLTVDGEARDRPWLMGAKIVNPDGTEQQGSRRETLTPWRAFVEATKLYRLAPRHPYFRRFNLHGDPCPTEITPVPVISGACFCLPRENFFAMGGMDERYFLHVEDVDFCLRFAKGGGVVYFNPKVEVVHFKSSSRVNPRNVELRKTRAITRYFRAHFSGVYPPLFLSFVSSLLWLHFGLKSAAGIMTGTVGVFGLGVRRGAPGYRRVAEMSARRKGR